LQIELEKNQLSAKFEPKTFCDAGAKALLLVRAMQSLMMESGNIFASYIILVKFMMTVYVGYFKKYSYFYKIQLASMDTNC